MRFFSVKVSPVAVTMAVRRGPKLGDSRLVTNYRKEFLTRNIFSASGKSANIISSGTDLSILLNTTEITDAVREFREEQKHAYLKKNKDWNEQEAVDAAAKLTVPERVYREKMKPQEGLIIFYLFDSYYTFLQERGKEDPEFTKLVRKEFIDLNVPITGIAIGFPPIEPDPGGVYVHGDYGFDTSDDTEITGSEDLAIPDDFNA